MPDGVIIRTCEAPPAASTPCVLVTMVNSPTMSEVGRLGTKSSEFVRMKLSWMLMPSCVVCVHVGRPPLMAVLLRAAMPGTPACRRISSIGLRALSGSSRICSWRTVLVTSGVVVWTRSTPAVTCTASLSPPISSAAASEYSWPGSTLTSL